MKKYIILLISLSFLFVGCSKKKEETVQEQIVQKFTNIDLELHDGELEVVIADDDTLSLTHQNGTEVDYEISSDTLIINKTSKGNLTLTLPADYIYEDITINSDGGDLTFKPLPECSHLTLNIQDGEVVLSKAVATQTDITLNQGYIYLSGKLGDIVNINCIDGYIKLKPKTTKEKYNYDLNLHSDGYLNLGGYKYDNLEVTEQLYQMVDANMNIEITSGNVIVAFTG